VFDEAGDNRLAIEWVPHVGFWVFWTDADWKFFGRALAYFNPANIIPMGQEGVKQFKFRKAIMVYEL